MPDNFWLTLGTLAEVCAL